MTPAERLSSAQRETGSLLSVGLEPDPRRLPAGVEPTIEAHESFLRTVIEATAGLACAYKANLAFFEALGAPGWALLERIRAAVSAQTVFIADAKRGDIGSTAERYAEAIYGRLGADAATVNPLMGRDSVEPWLAWDDRLTFFLVATSNPGAKDFLVTDGLHERIAARLTEWGAPGRAGFVVGATRGDVVASLRAIGPDAPFLVPGVGAQGGDARAVAEAGAIAPGRPGAPGLVFHVSRGILPGADESGDIGAVIRAKAEVFRDRIRDAIGAAA